MASDTKVLTQEQAEDYQRKGCYDLDSNFEAQQVLKSHAALLERVGERDAELLAAKKREEAVAKVAGLALKLANEMRAITEGEFGRDWADDFGVAWALQSALTGALAEIAGAEGEREGV